MELTSFSAVFPSSSSPAIHSSLVLNVSSISISSSQVSSLFDDLFSARNLKDSMIRTSQQCYYMLKLHDFLPTLCYCLKYSFELWACFEHPEHSKISYVFLPMTRSHKKHFALTLLSFCRFCFGPAFGQPPERSIQQSGLNEAFVLLL